MVADSFLPDLFVPDKGRPACPIFLLTKQDLPNWLKAHAGRNAAWAQSNDFTAQSGRVLMIPDKSGGVEAVLVGQGEAVDYMSLGAVPKAVPAGTYRLADDLELPDMAQAAHGWMLGTYSFDTYRSRPRKKEFPQLVMPKQADMTKILALGEAVFLARDLINTPAADMGPIGLEAATRELAEKHGAPVHVIAGDDLVTQNYPLIHAVGRAAYEAPRFIEFSWGDEKHPKVTLVGKGVCFDSGGLNIKTGNYMDIMKKDMGGAANVLALASAIMQTGLKVRLRVLIGAVENAIGPDAFRPGDILPSRNGMTVEIGNTDAEGRLVLADLLTEAETEAPDLLVDMATLTGAARVALGPEVAPFYTHDEKLAEALANASRACRDAMWRMPLWAGYDGWLGSKIADVNHISSGPFAGSVVAALFLARFVSKKRAWVHCDVYAWNAKPRAGHPVGGEAQGVLALYHLIEQNYAS